MAYSKTKTQSDEPKRDLRQEVTDAMVAALEQGKIPWAKPWKNLDQGLPRNLQSGKQYNGGNRMLLLFSMIERGYSDPRFSTFQQIKAEGGAVNKGEKGIPVELWKDQKFWERNDVSVTQNGQRVRVLSEARGQVETSAGTVPKEALRVEHKGQSMAWNEARKLDSVVGKTYTVFNVQQTTGLQLAPLARVGNDVPMNERGEQIKAAMSRDGLGFSEGGNQAFYSPVTDRVTLPPRDAFKHEEGYYGTMLHEIGHATGAAQRLNRDGITGRHDFGSEGYAREELRAELFSMMAAVETGIPHDPEQHAAYVQSWAKVLKQDRNEIFRAASEASKACDYVFERVNTLKNEHAATAEATQAQPAEATMPMPPAPAPRERVKEAELTL